MQFNPGFIGLVASISILGGGEWRGQQGCSEQGQAGRVKAMTEYQVILFLPTSSEVARR